MSNCFSPGEWQHAASLRLQELLTTAKLRALVGDFEQSLRADRRAETGQNRPSSLAELADALLIAHDSDLLARKEVRKALVEALRARGEEVPDNPKRWRPGHATAHKFTRMAGLPTELAGIRTAERPSPFVTVAPPTPLRPLEPYQREVSDAMYLRLNQRPPHNRAMISLPTGAGKTRVAVETLHRWIHDRLEEGNRERLVVVWLAHTEELCEQAVECFEQIWRARGDGCHPLGLGRFWGGYRNGFDLDDLLALPATELPVLVLVSTPQSLINAAFECTPPADAIVIDEAHRAAAPTYRTIIEHYGEKTPIIGLTATPYRREFYHNAPQAGTLELRELFGHLVLPTSLGDDANSRLRTLQEMGVLSRPVSRTIPTRLTLKIPENLEADIDALFALSQIDRELREAADQTRRRRLVIDTLLNLLEENPSARVLYFGPSVKDAELVAFVLRTKGKRAMAVSGDTRMATRRAIVSAFKAGRIDILCNCEVLTTGFDAPTISHVVIARPTTSQVLYEQMVGRGLRGPKFGGTEQCLIVDFEDRFRRDRPQLGYEAFREIWHPVNDQMHTGSNTLGMVVQWGMGAPIHRKRRHGKAEVSSKYARRTMQLPLSIRLVGPGSAHLTIETVEKRSGQPASHAVLELDPSRPEIDYLVTIEKDHKLRLVSVTSEPRAYLDVRRENRTPSPEKGKAATEERPVTP